MTAMRPILLALGYAVAGMLPASAQERVLDAFDSLDGWAVVTADGVGLDLALDEGRHGQALRMDFDFRAGGGYAIARKAFPLDLPANYRLRFSVRAEGEGGGLPPVNDLEFKLVDPTGENVWWHNRRRFRYPTEWTRLTSKKRHLPFAWGPVGGGEVERVQWIEFVVTAVEGGRGSVWIDDFTFEPLPPDAPFTGLPVVTASSGDASAVVDGDPATAWTAPGGAQTLTLDLGREHELGGLALTWGDPPASDYDVDLSADGAEWTTTYSARGGRGGLDVVPLPEAEARFIRLRLLDTEGGSGYVLAEVEVLPLSASATPNDLFAEIARRSPPGRYPRYFYGEQTYWTVVGVDGDEHEALVGEDGTVEVAQGRFSIEPFLYDDGRLLGWHEADSTTHALMDGYLPIPSATRHYGDLRLHVTAFAQEEYGGARFVLRYHVENTGAAADSVRLFLAVRPFQVNPPQQWLNLPGGVGRIERLEVVPGGFAVDGRVVHSLVAADVVGATTYASGDVADWLVGGTVPRTSAVEDPLGYASGALTYDLSIPPGGSEEVVLRAMTLSAHRDIAFLEAASRAAESAEADRWQAAAAEAWRAKLDRVQFILPPEAEALGNTLRSQLAYVLINRDGDAVQPGSRSYERSWIRDGSLTSSALLRLGYPEAAEAFARWYAPFQYENGKVPCCVDRRGADPTPENDSHGQLIFLVAEVHRFTGDDAFLRDLWPHVEGAVSFMDSLRHQRMGPAYAANDSVRAYYGLLPESISHEGYSAKPMHSFWDQLFALRGLKDAVYVAEALGETEAAARFAVSRDAFAADLAASYRRTMAMHGIDYLPGAVELGDFDPTSVTIAMDPADAEGVLPEGALEATFERFWEGFVQRRDSRKDWGAYTPYEWRNVGALVRLGWKERAHEALDWYFSHRRPAGWNAFAEVVDVEPRRPRFLGDIPHTWVGSDFIRSVTDLFAYEAGDALVLGAGLPEAWAASPTGVGVRGLRTRHGPLSYLLRAEGDEAVFEIEDGLTAPPGGLLVTPPFEGALTATVDGEPAPMDEGAVRVHALPTRIVFRR